MTIVQSDSKVRVHPVFIKHYLGVQKLFGHPVSSPRPLQLRLLREFWYLLVWCAFFFFLSMFCLFLRVLFCINIFLYFLHLVHSNYDYWRNYDTCWSNVFFFFRCFVFIVSCLFFISIILYLLHLVHSNSVITEGTLVLVRLMWFIFYVLSLLLLVLFIFFINFYPAVFITCFFYLCTYFRWLFILRCCYSFILLTCILILYSALLVYVCMCVLCLRPSFHPSFFMHIFFTFH